MLKKIILVMVYLGSPLAFAHAESPAGNTSTTQESTKTAPTPALYLRLPNPWEVVSSPQYLSLEEKNLALQKKLDAVRSSLSENVFKGLTEAIHSPWINFLITQLDSPIEVFAFIPKDSPMPIPNIGFRAHLKCDSTQFQTAFSTLENKEAGLSIIKDLDAAGKAMIDIQGNPINLKFKDGQLSLFGGMMMQPNDSDEFDKFPKHFKAMDVAQSKVDTDGKGFFLWIDGPQAMTLLPTIDPAAGMIIPMIGLDELKSISMGWGRSEDLGRMRLLIETPRHGMLQNIPVTQSTFNLKSRGKLSQVTGVSLDLSDLYEKLMTNLSLFNPDLKDQADQLDKKVTEKIGSPIADLVTIFGPECFIFTEKIGSFWGLKVSNLKAFNSLIQSLQDQKRIEVQTKEIQGRTFVHLTMNSRNLFDVDMPLPPMFNFYKKMNEHLFYTIDDNFLVMSAIPQDLIERYQLKEGITLESWLTKEQRQRTTNSLMFSSTQIDDLPRTIHALWIQSVMVLNDISEAGLDIFELPSAKELNLPEYGRYGISLQLPPEGLALELNFEHNPFEVLTHSPSSVIVATASIAVMAGILMPSLAKAQEAANRIRDENEVEVEIEEEIEAEDDEIMTKEVAITRSADMPRLTIDQPIIISVPTNDEATDFRHLAIQLVITIGSFPNENITDAEFHEQLKQEQFMETAEKFTPWVKDQVNKIASEYSYAELTQAETKVEFREKLLVSMNDILTQYGLKPRFSEVLFTSFIFSD